MLSCDKTKMDAKSFVYGCDACPFESNIPRYLMFCYSMPIIFFLLQKFTSSHGYVQVATFPPPRTKQNLELDVGVNLGKKRKSNSNGYQDLCFQNLIVVVDVFLLALLPPPPPPPPPIIPSKSEFLFLGMPALIANPQATSTLGL